MKHIRQINSVNTNTYTVVISEGYGGENQPPLENHPCIVEMPNDFEIVDCELPDYYQFMLYIGMDVAN